MSSQNTTSISRLIEKFAKKSDMALAEIIRTSDEKNDHNYALLELQKRFDDRVDAYLRKSLPPDWIDQVKQIIWEHFDLYISRYKVVEGVPNLLMTIAHHKRVDAVKQVKREREIEANEPVEEYFSYTEDFTDDEDQDLPYLQFRTFYKDAFMNSMLTGCQRVLLELRRFHGYRSKNVGRLLGKGEGNVNTQIKYATDWVKGYFKSEHYQLALEGRKQSPLWNEKDTPANTLVIDRFSTRVMPEFTPEELKPIGITMRELKRHFEFALLFPHSYYDDATSLTPPSLLLTRKPDYREFKRIFNRLKRNPNNLPDEFPVEGLIRVDVEDGNFLLRVEPMVQIYPDPEQMLTDDQFMLLHSPQMKIPIALTTYDHELSEFTGDKRIWRRFYDV